MSEISGMGEPLATPKPEFNGGAFTISHFSPSPHGFEVKTRNVLGRTEGSASNHLDPERFERLAKFDEAIRQATERGSSEQEIDELQKEKRVVRRELGPNASRLRDAMKGEAKFNKVDLLHRALQDWRGSQWSGAPADDLAFLQGWSQMHRDRVRNAGKHIGIRNINVSGNDLSIDAKYVSYPVYNELANAGNSPELIDLSANVGTAMIIRTADNRLVIQHRAVSKQRLTEPKLSRGNAVYNDIPGASVAGLQNASLNGEDRMPGTPDRVDSTSIKTNILKETGEELGLGSEDLGEVRIVGLAHDKIKIHDEFLLLADSMLTADQIRMKSRDSNRNKNLPDADFEEKFIDIDGSADSIATLLTEVKCPLPPTHAAALVASGYSVVLQEQGKNAADAWKNRVEEGIRNNYRDIDQRVKAFYDKHPKALMQVPERFWGKRPPARRTHAYDPAYAPEEQGLASFEDAMVESGLSPETRRHVDKAYLFDVDGVLSDPQEKRVTESELFNQVITRLQRGEPAGLNTGRSTEWLTERFITPLLERIKEKSILQNFVAIGEKAGTWITFDKEGNMHHGKAKTIAIPEEVIEEAKELVKQKYQDSMFFDATKETMLSIEIHDGFDLDTFHQRQRELAEDLAQLLERRGLGENYRIDPTNIATDVESPYVGKALGAERFLQFLRDSDINPAEFETFGDSKSDFEMSDELERKGKGVKMIYVGDRSKLGELKKEYSVDYVGNFSQGTLDYLHSE